MSFGEYRPLFGPSGRLRVLFDHGPVGGTAAAPHILETDDGEYVAKCDRWYPGEPPAWIMANEYICAYFATILGLSLPRFALIEDEDGVYVGSKRLPDAFPLKRSEELGTCQNRDDLHRLAVFDIWMHNTDRHTGNLLITGRGLERRWWMIDHSHCPLWPSFSLEQLGTYHDRNGATLVQDWLSEHVTRTALLRQAIDQVQRVSFEEIEHVVARAPGALWTDEEQQRVAALINGRKTVLRMLVNDQAPVLPALGKEAL